MDWACGLLGQAQAGKFYTLPHFWGLTLERCSTRLRNLDALTLFLWLIEQDAAQD